MITAVKEKNEEINALFLIAEERCSHLMEDEKYKESISSISKKKVLEKGYLQGFYEALLIVKER